MMRGGQEWPAIISYVSTIATRMVFVIMALVCVTASGVERVATPRPVKTGVQGMECVRMAYVLVTKGG